MICAKTKVTIFNRNAILFVSITALCLSVVYGDTNAKVLIGSQADYKTDKALWTHSKAVISIEDELIKITEAGPKDYGAGIVSIRCDLEQYPYLEINIPRLDEGAQWDLHIRENIDSTNIPLQESSSKTGVFRYELKSRTGWSGQKDFKIFLWVRGEGKSVYFKSLRLMNISRTREVPPPKVAKISLKLQETQGCARIEEPVTTGIPFPKGVLASMGNAQIVDANGKNVPCQFNTLSKWDDGSVRWLLADFQVNLSAEREKQYYLKYGSSVQHELVHTDLKIEDRPDKILVSTGAIRFSINKEGFNLFDEVCLEECRGLSEKNVVLSDKGGIICKDAKDVEYLSLFNHPTIEVEEQGPLRTVIKVEGSHLSENGDKFLDYVTRIYIYAGKPYVRMFYTFIHRDSAEYDHIKEIKLKLPTVVSVGKVTVGIEGEKNFEYSLPAGKSITAVQDSDKHYDIIDSKFKLASGAKLAGWINLSDRNKGVMAVVKNCWQNFPKSLGADNGTISIGIWPEQTGTLDFFQGAAKTHEIIYYFHRGDSDSAKVGEYMAAAQEPVLATAPPEWYAKSGAYGDILTSLPRYSQYENFIQNELQSAMNLQKIERWYGIVGYGDIEARNAEADYHHGLFLQYLRTGERRYFDFGEAMARHVMDIDVIHYTTRSPLMSGAAVRHNPTHWGGVKRVVVPSHNWLRGFLDYYHLTGYRRALEAAVGMGDFLLRMNEETLKDRYNPNHKRIAKGGRETGRTIEQLTALYQATGDKRFLDGAAKAVQLILDEQQPDGSWFSAYITKKPRTRAWQLYDKGGLNSGIILGGLKLYHKITDDEQVKKAFLLGVDYMIWEAMTTERDGFIYGTTHGDWHTTHRRARNRSIEYNDFTSIQMLENLAYAYCITYDREYLAIGLKVLDNLPGRAKSWQADGLARHIPYFLYALNDAGMSQTSLSEKKQADENKKVPVPVEVWDLPKRIEIGKQSEVDIGIKNNLSFPVEVQVSLDTPNKWSVVPTEHFCRLNANSVDKLKFVLDIPKKANIGMPVNIRTAYDGYETIIRSNIKVVRIKTNVGYIDVPQISGHYLDESLTKYGIAYTQIDDVSKDELSKYHVIYVGPDAYKSDTAGIVESYEKILNYVRQGGVLVIFMINDKWWDTKYLPFKLEFCNTSGETGRIVSSKSKLFSIKHLVNDISGIIEYDTIEKAADNWTVLASNTNGKPSIVEAKYGTGHILVCQPAVERYYAGALVGNNPDKSNLYCALFENIVEYAEFLSSDRK